MGQRNKMWVYFCTGVVLVLLFLAEQAYIVKQWHEALDAQHRRNAIKVQLLTLQRLAADIDNGFRGYALMRQSMFLAPMVAAEAEIPQVLRKLNELMESTPSLQGTVQVLRRRMEELVDTKRRLTLKIDSGHQEEVLMYVRTGDGLALAKTIANAFVDLETKIEREFHDADILYADKQKQTMWQLVAAQGGAVFVGVLVIELLLSTFSSSHRQEV
ncbi:CHASE3 domain-containing protein [Nitrospira sp. KM1]|uniref:CHASE3 domain-containing protein n=1 Tax=Nitrospira sp. KM1 TaxID=1936990 RepID=UPI0015673B8A|nr:CHASE3 domain-containing protein [Nitrospira sp. KM1]